MNEEQNTQGTPPVQPEAPAPSAPAPEAPAPTPTPEPAAPSAPAPAVASISERLSGTAKAEVEKNPDAPQSETPAPAFDITKLSADQLQQLKAMLNVTPDRAVQKKSNPIIMLRRIKDKFIKDFKNSRLALVYDPNRLSEVEALVIPVNFVGEAPEKYVDVLYTEFMQGDQIPCEVLSTREHKDFKTEGQVVQRESGRLVDMEVWTLQRFFTVKLPDGSTIEIEGKVSNA